VKAYKVPQLARDLNMDRKTIYRLIHSGQLRAFKVGSDWRITEKAVEEFIREGERETEAMVRRARGYRGSYNPQRPRPGGRGDVEYWKRRIDAIGKDKPKDWVEELERKAREGKL